MKDATVQKLFEKLSAAVPDKTTPGFYRPEFAGFLDGSGYACEPKPGAVWRCGFARERALPQTAMGAVYVSGSDGKKRRLEDVPNPQFIRAAAVDDGSGRGIHVFASVDCVGLTNTEVKEIRALLREEIEAYDLLSVNICATGAVGGADTLGLWRGLGSAAAENLRAVRARSTAGNALAGRNADVMEYLRYAAAKCVRAALADLREGELSRGETRGGSLLRFLPAGGGRAVYAACRNGVLYLDDTPGCAPPASFEPVSPLLDVFLTPLLVPADNAALLFAAKLRLVNNPMCRLSLTDDKKHGDYYYTTEAGVLRLGGRVLALVPTEADGFGLSTLAQICPGARVMGLVNDTLGVRRLRGMLNGVAARLPLDAGKRTQAEINGALARTARPFCE